MFRLLCRYETITAQEWIKDFFSKYDQIRRKLQIWSHVLNKSLMENFIFCSVYQVKIQIQVAFYVKSRHCNDVIENLDTTYHV